MENEQIFEIAVVSMETDLFWGWVSFRVAVSIRARRSRYQIDPVEKREKRRRSRNGLFKAGWPHIFICWVWINSSSSHILRLHSAELISLTILTEPKPGHQNLLTMNLGHQNRPITNPGIEAKSRRCKGLVKVCQCCAGPLRTSRISSC